MISAHHLFSDRSANEGEPSFFSLCHLRSPREPSKTNLAPSANLNKYKTGYNRVASLIDAACPLWRSSFRKSPSEEMKSVRANVRCAFKNASFLIGPDDSDSDDLHHQSQSKQWCC
jgi:hypothetical protein